MVSDNRKVARPDIRPAASVTNRIVSPSQCSVSFVVVTVTTMEQPRRVSSGAAVWVRRRPTLDDLDDPTSGGYLSGSLSLEPNDDLQRACFSLDGLHDALLSAVVVDKTDEISSAEYLVVGGMPAERVYVKASGVSAVSVMVAVPLIGATSEMVTSINFMEWCSSLADDAVDVLSVVASMPAARRAPCMLEVTGGKQTGVRLDRGGHPHNPAPHAHRPDVTGNNNPLPAK